MALSRKMKHSQPVHVYGGLGLIWNRASVHPQASGCACMQRRGLQFYGWKPLRRNDPIASHRAITTVGVTGTRGRRRGARCRSHWDQPDGGRRQGHDLPLPPGNPENVQILSVSANAVAAHVANHGDTVLGTVDSCTGCGDVCIAVDDCTPAACTEDAMQHHLSLSTVKSVEQTAASLSATALCRMGAASNHVTASSVLAGKGAVTAAVRFPPMMVKRLRHDFDVFVGSCNSDSDCAPGAVCDATIGDGNGNNLCTVPCLTCTG